MGKFKGIFGPGHPDDSMIIIISILLASIALIYFSKNDTSFVGATPIDITTSLQLTCTPATMQYTSVMTWV